MDTAEELARDKYEDLHGRPLNCGHRQCGHFIHCKFPGCMAEWCGAECDSHGEPVKCEECGDWFCGDHRTQKNYVVICAKCAAVEAETIAAVKYGLDHLLADIAAGKAGSYDLNRALNRLALLAIGVNA